MVDRYDGNRVVDITDPTVRITSVLTMMDSRAMRRNVSPILASHSLTGFLSKLSGLSLTVRSFPVLAVTHSAVSYIARQVRHDRRLKLNCIFCLFEVTSRLP